MRMNTKTDHTRQHRDELGHPSTVSLNQALWNTTSGDKREKKRKTGG